MFKKILFSGFAWLVIGYFLLLLLAPILPVYNDKTSIANALHSPNLQHWLGFDYVGRDLFSRLSMAVYDAVLPAWLSVSLGAALGFGIFLLDRLWSNKVLSGLLRGLLNINILIICLPVFLLVFALNVLYQVNQSIFVYLVIGYFTCFRVFHFLMGLYLKDRNLGYWESAEVLGASRFHGIFNYGMRQHWLGPLMVFCLAHLHLAIVLETSLSYLQFGVQEPSASLGNLLSSHFTLIFKDNSLAFWIVLGNLLLILALPQVLIKRFGFAKHLMQKESLQENPN